jgi:hypothetical protein
VNQGPNDMTPFEEYARIVATLPTIDEVLKDSPILKAYASGGFDAVLKHLGIEQPSSTRPIDDLPESPL